jgi:hypothetical protein
MMGDYLYDGDCEPFEFYSERLCKSRLNRICHESGLKINSGDRYYRIACKFDGEFYDYSIAFDVMELIKKYKCPIGCCDIMDIDTFEVNQLKERLLTQ